MDDRRIFVKRVYWQLLGIFTVLTLLMSLGIFSKYSVQMNIFAVVTALFSIGLELKQSKLKIPEALLLLSFLLMLATRLYPYLGSNIPLGYDAGMYRATFESSVNGNVRPWMKIWSPRGLFLIAWPFVKLFGVDNVLIYGLILCELILVFSVYLFAKIVFNKEAAIVASVLVSISVIQFKSQRERLETKRSPVMCFTG